MPVFVFLNGIKPVKEKRNRKMKKEPKAADKGVSETGFPKPEFADQVRRLIEPFCIAEGLELVHAEFHREPSGRVLRLYIDSPEGVTLDDCARISRQAGDIIDAGIDSAEDLSYHLEVSSPGPDRPLGKFDDFNRFKGNMATIKIKPEIGDTDDSPKKKKNKIIRGVLEGIVDDETVKIRVGDEMRNIHYKDIIRANLVNYNGELRC